MLANDGLSRGDKAGGAVALVSADMTVDDAQRALDDANAYWPSSVDDAFGYWADTSRRVLRSAK